MIRHTRNLACPCCRLLKVALLLCAALVGCRSWDTAPPADPDPDAQIGARLRTPGPPGQLLGIDQRAREIEHNLGVR